MDTLNSLLPRVTRGGGNTGPINRHGGLRWLPGPFVDYIQLDIVGFLAILGEGSITANLQVSTLSKFVFVPRLLPAPQVFFRPTRDAQLAPRPGNVTGVHSGNDKDFINYLGHVVLDAEDMPDYSVRCVEIYKEGKEKVKARTKGPLTFLVFLGFAESVAILGVSIYNRDGFALLAVILLSFLSSLAGLANWWYLELPKRRKMQRKVVGKAGQPTIQWEPPPGDVVVRHPKGSFLVVQCTEDVARELYFAPENVYYLIESPWAYRLMSLIGTLMLMLGIVALGNADNVQQILFAASYMILNAAYWLVAALPARLHWDLSMYKIKKQKLICPPFKYAESEDSSEVKKQPSRKERRQQAEMDKIAQKAAKTYTDLNPNFTWAMWKTIAATESIAWVKKNDALPETPVWNEWLQDALKQARGRRAFEQPPDPNDPDPEKCEVRAFDVPDWDPQAHFYDILNKHNMQSATASPRATWQDPAVRLQDPMMRLQERSVGSTTSSPKLQDSKVEETGVSSGVERQPPQ